MAPRSLIQLLRDKHLSTIRNVVTPSRWKVLVVDSFTQELLSSVVKMYDILQEGVSTVENIEQRRSPQPSFEAVYLLCPTSRNVDRIIQDLGRPDAQYSCGHIFFVDGLSDPLLQRLTSSAAEPKLRQLIELFVNFWPTESQVFLLKTPQTFFTLFQPPGPRGPDANAISAIEEEVQVAAQTLLNVCVTLNEFPLIRYYNPSHPPLGPLAPPPGSINAAAPAAGSASASLYAGSARMARLRGDNGWSGGSNGGVSPSHGAANGGEHFTRKLALQLQRVMDAYVRDNQPKPDPGRPRGVLFITDRTMDTVAPFLHEFSYQAMINDLLPLEDGGTRYRYAYTSTTGEMENKDAHLSDDDAIWVGIRHLHIAEAIDRLTRDFAAHAGEQQGMAAGSSLNDMRDMLANLPHMQEMKEKLSLHLTMAQDCMNRYQQSRLPDQAMVEQNCATRVTPDGSKPRTLVEEMVPLLDDRSVPATDKVRIIALYIMYCEGVPEEDRKRLFQHARLSLREMDTVDNLVHLGARVVKDPSNSGWDAWFKKASKRKQAPAPDNEYELSRYVPAVGLMIDDHFSNKLEQSMYPYVTDAPPEMPGLSATTSGPTATAAGFINSALSAAGRESLRPAANGPSARSQPSSLRSAKPTWHQRPRVGGGGGGTGSSNASSASLRTNANGGGGGPDNTRQRVLVFVAGGCTYSEIRTAYRMGEKWSKDVYVGSSHVFTPERFLDALNGFGKASGGAGSGSTAVQHGGAPHHHQPHLPSSANALSKPSNDMSGLRSRSDKVRNATPSHTPGGAYDQYSQDVPSHHHTPHHSQHHHHPQAPPPISVPAVSQSTYDRRYGGNSSPVDKQLPGLSISAADPHGRVGGSSPAPTARAPFPASGLHPGSDRGASPAPSANSATKKKSKNPFSFKK